MRTAIAWALTLLLSTPFVVAGSAPGPPGSGAPRPAASSSATAPAATQPEDTPRLRAFRAQFAFKPIILAGGFSHNTRSGALERYFSLSGELGVPDDAALIGVCVAGRVTGLRDAAGASLLGQQRPPTPSLFERPRREEADAAPRPIFVHARADAASLPKRLGAIDAEWDVLMAETLDGQNFDLDTAVPAATIAPGVRIRLAMVQTNGEELRFRLEYDASDNRQIAVEAATPFQLRELGEVFLPRVEALDGEGVLGAIEPRATLARLDHGATRGTLGCALKLPPGRRAETIRLSIARKIRAVSVPVTLSDVTLPGLE